MNPTKKISPLDLLKPGNMIRLYATGAFPMADNYGKINWFIPEIRTIIPLDKYNIPRSLKIFLKKNDFEIRIDTDFLSVIKGCAGRKKTWISEELIEAYKRLQKKGYLHSIETWQNEKLVGGLFGITFRGAFFGESMFSKVPQASKAALAKLIEHLNLKDFILLDVQYMTEHLRMFGAVEIDFEEYNRILYSAYTRACEF